MMMDDSCKRRPLTMTVLAMVVPALLLAACSEESSRTPTKVQLANPASVHCEQRGGRLELVDEAAGQVGYCVLPDGRRVEEWAFFRASQGGDDAPAGTPP
jgi:putative hemolysin